jgi:hypothetical protein
VGRVRRQLGLALVDTALAAVDVTTAQVVFELARPGSEIAALSRRRDGGASTTTR